MLRHLELHPVYDSAEYDLIQDLVTPLLSESREYWRGVGFFTSGWLRMACEGIVHLVNNGGKAHIVTSPVMEKTDWEALQAGDRARRDRAFRNLLSKHVANLAGALSKDTLNALAWMVSDDIIEFRFAIPRDFGMGDYHDKVGIFIDKAEDEVAIHGSFNDSVKGSLNGEAFSVFRSWVEGQRPYVEQHRTRLLNLWNNENRQFQVLELPDAIREEIVRLRLSRRPYDSTIHSNLMLPPSLIQAHESHIELRPYQKEALDTWEKNGFRGIFEMATGTGKTFTALAAADKRRDVLNQAAVIIIVPYLHLLEQWRQNCERFGFFPILCSGNHEQWPNEVRSKIQDFRLGGLRSICILAVHQTAASRRFTKAVQDLQAEKTLLIADEVHGLGAPKLRDALLPNADMRLGLSATPRRWYDNEGTQALLDYFTGICFEYTLEQAIGTYLTPYRYLPVPTLLTPDESREYENLSQKIAVFSRQDLEGDIEAGERLKKLLLQRAQIVSAAENKLPLLLKALGEQIEICKVAGEELRNLLVYCAPGKHKEILKAVSDLGIRCHEFVHTVSLKKREDVLHQFSNGDIQALIAIHCLDEGVDIPATQTAYFLSSTTNPKEFIQRRGRILRKFPEKKRADVYDFVVLPDRKYAHLRKESDLSLLRREMPRFAEFAEASENEFSARAIIRDVIDDFQMLHLFDIKPWDIYHEVMESVEIGDRS